MQGPTSHRKQYINVIYVEMWIQMLQEIHENTGKFSLKVRNRYCKVCVMDLVQLEDNLEVLHILLYYYITIM